MVRLGPISARRLGAPALHGLGHEDQADPRSDRALSNFWRPPARAPHLPCTRRGPARPRWCIPLEEHLRVSRISRLVILDSGPGTTLTQIRNRPSLKVKRQLRIDLRQYKITKFAHINLRSNSAKYLLWLQIAGHEMRHMFCRACLCQSSLAFSGFD